MGIANLTAVGQIGGAPVCLYLPLRPTMPDRPGHFHPHRYPAEIISYAVWLYHRFALSFRDVDELLFERGVIVTYGTVRVGGEVRSAVRASRPSCTAVRNAAAALGTSTRSS